MFEKQPMLIEAMDKSSFSFDEKDFKDIVSEHGSNADQLEEQPDLDQMTYGSKFDHNNVSISHTSLSKLDINGNHEKQSSLN